MRMEFLQGELADSTPCLRKKNSQNCFLHNFVKFQLTLIIFDINMAKRIKLCQM